MGPDERKVVEALIRENGEDTVLGVALRKYVQVEAERGAAIRVVEAARLHNHIRFCNEDLPCGICLALAAFDKAGKEEG